MVQYKATDVRSNARCLNVSTSLCVLGICVSAPKGVFQWLVESSHVYISSCTATSKNTCLVKSERYY